MDRPCPEPPVPLPVYGRGYWDRHAPRLWAAQVIQDEDLESFALHCITWDKLVVVGAVAPGADNFREMVQFGQLHKNYMAGAKQFGLLPRERRHSKLADAVTDEEADEFGL